MLVFLLVPTLQGWGQLRVSITPSNYRASPWEQACLLGTLNWLPILQIKCGAGAFPPGKGEEQQTEQAWPLVVLSLGQEKRGRCSGLGDAQWIYTSACLGFSHLKVSGSINRVFHVEQHHGPVVKRQVRTDQIRQT